MISKKVFLRDLKMENILVKISEDDLEELVSGNLSKINDAKFVLCDFGNSKIFTDMNEQFKSTISFGAYGTMGILVIYKQPYI